MSAFRSLIVITGGQMGLGYEATRVIAKQKPDALNIICSRSSGDEAAQKINKETGHQNVEWQRLDLGDLSDVRRFAGQVLARNLPISGLILNAGLQVPQFKKTKDDIEMAFGVNHVGHALLFHLLVPKFTDNARVVITSSATHDPAIKTGMPPAAYDSAELMAHPDEKVRKFNGQQVYSSTKLCNILWAYALERHRKERGLNFTVNALDPGLMPGTGLARDFPAPLRFAWNHVLPRMLPVLRLMLTTTICTPQESGKAMARLAVAPELANVSGKYFEGQKEMESSKDSHDPAKQEDLWEWTANFVAKDKEEADAFKDLKV